MTPSNLLTALQRAIKESVKNYRMEAENQSDKPVSVYLQHLPDEAFSDDTYYPFVLLTVQKTQDSDAQGELEAATATLGIMVATYGSGQNAWRDLINLTEHIRQHLLGCRTLDKRHRLILPLKWNIPEVQPYPFWHSYGTAEYTIGQPQECFPYEMKEEW